MSSVATLVGACASQTVPVPIMHVIVRTDMRVPQDLDEVRIEAKVQGVRFHQDVTLLGPGLQQLPHDFAVPRRASVGNLPVQFTAVGYLHGKPVVERRSITSIPDDGGSFVMKLEYLCRGSSSFDTSMADAKRRCRENETCSGGTCGDAQLNPATDIRPFEEATVVGATLACFDVEACFPTLAVDHPRWDGDRCVLRVDGQKEEPLNIAVLRNFVSCRPGANTPCLVALDEGNGPGDVRLEPGGVVLPKALCDGSHPGVVISQRCPSKRSDQPLCASPLPAPASSLPFEPPREPPIPPSSATPSPADAGWPLVDGDAKESQDGDGVQAGKSFVVQGTVSGLTADGLVLELKGQGPLRVPPGESRFAFSSLLAAGEAFEVGIQVQPPSLRCNLHEARGTVDGMAEAQVRVECSSVVRVRQVSAGAYHTCVLLEDGAVRCWGEDATGQLGGSTVTTSIPGLNDVVFLAAGQRHTCALLSTGRVRCWGADDAAQLADSNTATDILGLSGVETLSTKNRHTCALLTTGTVRCWGEDSNGRRGGSSAEQDVPGLSGVTAVSAGEKHTCVLLRGGAVRCWGDNSANQTRGSNPTTDIEGLSSVVTLVGGFKTTCAVLATGDVQCWGNPQLGAEATIVLGDLYSVPGVKQFSLGDAHGCAVLSSGTARCWGSLPWSAPGKDRSYDPLIDIKGLSDVVSVSAGGYHTCAILSSGELRCWGLNDQGQLGGGRAPRRVEGIDDINTVATGQCDTCAQGSSGQLRCWGFLYGGPAPGGGTFGTRVADLGAVLGLAQGATHACAVLSKGTVRCWGSNDHQELGGSSLDTDVPGLSGAIAVAVGERHSCALLSSGRMRCWGWRGGSLDMTIDPTLGGDPSTDIPDVFDVRAITAGQFHTCVLLARGTVRCWGDGTQGQTGNGSSTTDIPGLSGVMAIAAGKSHTCVLLNSGFVRCFGSNAFGQCAGSSTTLPVLGPTGVVQVAAGGAHTCVRLSEGSVRCWGQNNQGQTAGASPTRSVPGIPKATFLATGEQHTCIVEEGGWMTCWGSDGCGQSSGQRGLSIVDVPLNP